MLSQDTPGFWIIINPDALNWTEFGRARKLMGYVLVALLQAWYPPNCRGKCLEFFPRWISTLNAFILWPPLPFSIDACTTFSKIRCDIYTFFLIPILSIPDLTIKPICLVFLCSFATFIIQIRHCKPQRKQILNKTSALLISDIPKFWKDIDDFSIPFHFFSVTVSFFDCGALDFPLGRFSPYERDRPTARHLLVYELRGMLSIRLTEAAAVTHHNVLCWPFCQHLECKSAPFSPPLASTIPLRNVPPK